MRSIVKDQSGTVIALFALSLPVVLTAIGVAVDYSDLVRKRTSLQSAADDAALASTKVLALSGAATPPQKETEARIAAEKIINDRAAGSGRTIAPSSASRTVEVTLTLDKPTFFGALYNDSDVALRVTARAHV
jgi:Flp pilus assembly protein TadG